jgi:hypothetical protein
MPEGAVYVGRPTVWGNPFAYRTPYGLARVPAVETPSEAWEYEGRISADGTRHDYHHPDGRVIVCHVRYMSRAECVETYRRALVAPTPQLHLFARPGKRITIDDVRRELTGKDLACWCPLGEPCHVDVLLAVANEVPGV